MWHKQKLTGLRHPALGKSSGWEYNQRYRELQASHKRGIAVPSEFDALGKDDQLDILAWYEASWRIEVINAWEQNEESKRDANRARRKGKK